MPTESRITSRPWTTVHTAAIAVLRTADADAKAAAARDVAALWQNDALTLSAPDTHSCTPPDRPARPVRPELLPPARMPKRRKAGSLETRTALIHAVAHIELNAIDLAFDMVARFVPGMPRSFLDDWIRVGADEARHFTLLQNRLKDMGSFYGALPAHDGLWESALATMDDIAARLAVVPMVLEARGLDVTPAMIMRFEKTGDSASAKALKTIYEEEISHVAAGSRWFHFIAGKRNADPQTLFQTLVRQRFKGLLKPPFNTLAREEAGLPADWYEPLAVMPVSPGKSLISNP